MRDRVKLPLLALLLVALPASTVGAHAADCRDESAAIIGSSTASSHDHGSHGGHHHRRLDHGAAAAAVHLTYSATCAGGWKSLIENYTASDGSTGTSVYVFSDSSTTATVDVSISRNGMHLMQTSVTGHLHVGSCFDGATPAFVNSVRADTTGAHWADANGEEVHFNFNTSHHGEALARTCTSAEVTTAARSIVLHEDDANAVIRMGAKKLCCDLSWTAHPSAASARAVATSPLLAVLTATLLLAGFVF